MVRNDSPVAPPAASGARVPSDIVSVRLAPLLSWPVRGAPPETQRPQGRCAPQLCRCKKQRDPEYGTANIGAQHPRHGKGWDAPTWQKPTRPSPTDSATRSRPSSPSWHPFRRTPLTQQVDQKRQHGCIFGSVALGTHRHQRHRSPGTPHSPSIDQPVPRHAAALALQHERFWTALAVRANGAIKRPRVRRRCGRGGRYGVSFNQSCCAEVCSNASSARLRGRPPPKPVELPLLPITRSRARRWRPCSARWPQRRRAWAVGWRMVRACCA